MSAAQSDLFERPGLPGLAQAEAFVTSSQEQALIRSIDAAALSPFRFHDERDRGVEFLLGPGFPRIDIGSRIVTADHVADAPFQHGMAIARCMAAKPRVSVYETRGLEFIELRMS
jgi:hypothetical protein